MLVLTYDTENDCVATIYVPKEYKKLPQAIAEKFYCFCRFWPDWLLVVKKDRVRYRYFRCRDYSEGPKPHA